MRASAPAGPRGRGRAASQPRTRPAAAAPPPIRRDAPGRRRGLRLVVVAAATAGLVAGATWLVGWSPVLGVGAVTVQGSTRVDADRIVAAAAVEPGTPLARLDAEQIRSQVLAALPRIADVEVRRGWPRELVIVVDERVPVAVVAGDVGYRLVDASGAAYLDVTGQPEGLPLLQVDPANTAAVAAGVAVAAGLPEDLRRRVTEISATTVDDVTLTMRSGAEVTWGNPEDTGVKSRVLAAMLGLDARAYDVSAPELPTSTGAANSRGRSDQTAGDDPAIATGSFPRQRSLTTDRL